MPITLNNGTATVDIHRVVVDFERNRVRCIYAATVQGIKGEAAEAEIIIPFAQFRAAAPATGPNGRATLRALDRILCEAIAAAGDVSGGAVADAV